MEVMSITCLIKRKAVKNKMRHVTCHHVDHVSTHASMNTMTNMICPYHIANKKRPFLGYLHIMESCHMTPEQHCDYCK